LFTVALGVSAPLIVQSTQIYPDLLAGAIAAAVLVVMIRRATRRNVERSNVRYVMLGLVALMPWLHIRFVLPCVILTAAILWLRRKTRWRSAALEAVPTVVSIGTLCAYNLFAFGNLSGVYGSGGRAIEPGWTAFSVFIGLNVDRYQGMFTQQPLLLLGILGIAYLFRRARDIGALTVALYLAFVVPNALHPTWYGGASFAGRFGLSAAIVLLIPAGVALAELARRWVVATFALAVGAIALNAWMYDRIWRGGLPLLGGPVAEPRSVYPSWLPLLGRSLPALDVAKWAGTFVPNYVVPVALIGFAFGCALIAATRTRAGTALAVLSVAAFVIPTASANPTLNQDVVELHVGRSGHLRGGVIEAAPGHDAAGLLAAGPNFRMSTRSDWLVTVQYSSSAPARLDTGVVTLTSGITRWCSVRLPGTTNRQTGVDISWRPRQTSGLLQIDVAYRGVAPIQLDRVSIGHGAPTRASRNCGPPPHPRSTHVTLATRSTSNTAIARVAHHH